MVQEDDLQGENTASLTYYINSSRTLVRLLVLATTVTAKRTPTVKPAVTSQSRKGISLEYLA